MTKTDPEYAVLVIRIALGLLYVAHALLVLIVFGFEQAPRFLVLAELLGGTILALGFCTRAIAIGLAPIGIGTALASSTADIGINLSQGLFFATCFAGQALLASGSLTRVEEEESQFEGSIHGTSATR